MTPVNIHLISPDGQPLADVKFHIIMPGSGFDQSGTEISMPKTLVQQTDAEGKVQVSLYPVIQHPYTLVVVDPVTGATMREEFYVPEHHEAVELREIILNPAPTNRPYDEAAIQQITQNKLDAELARVGAETAEANAKASEQQVADDAASAAADRLHIDGQVTHVDSQVSHVDGQAVFVDQRANDADASATAAATSEANASASEAAADEDATQTADDRRQTGEDRVQTGLDRDAASASQVAAKASEDAAAASKTAADQDAQATAADRVATNADAQATASDRVATGEDAAATAADRVQTGLDRQAAADSAEAADLDAQATAADRAQTGLDRTAASDSATAAADSATLADQHRQAAAESETNAAQSEGAAQDHLNAFLDRYYGDYATPPAVSPTGNAPEVGDLYFDTTEGALKIWTSAGWRNATTVVEGVYDVHEYRSQEGNDSFTLDYDVGLLQVLYNGVQLASDDFTADNGTSVTLAQPVTKATDVITLIRWGAVTQATFIGTAAQKDVEDFDPAGAAAQAEANAKSYTDMEIASLVASAPGALDTLNELAQALGDDPNFATTMTNALGQKLDASVYTASDVLAKLLTVDGTGSGLDADLLGGQPGYLYARLDQNNTIQTNSGGVRIAGSDDRGYLQGLNSAGENGGLWLTGILGAKAPRIELYSDQVTVDGSQVLHSGNTGNAVYREVGVNPTQLPSTELSDLRYARLSGANNFDTMPSVNGDPIVESDSNSDGDWTRWADGSQVSHGIIECFGGDGTSNSKNGSHPLPVAFVGHVAATGVNFHNSGWRVFAGGDYAEGHVNTTIGWYAERLGGSWVDGLTYGVGFIAKGYWK